MYRISWFFVSIGCLLGIGTLLQTAMMTSFDGWLFMILAIMLSSLGMLPIVWRKLMPARNFLWLAVGSALMYLGYLSGFSIGFYLFLSSGFILLGSIVSLLHDYRVSLIRSKEDNPATSHAMSPLEDSRQRKFDLTMREAEIIKFIAMGKTNKEIAEDLVISVNTVRHHVHQILKKLGCSSRAEVALLAKSMDQHLGTKFSKIDTED